jgi:hypothetical protein
MGLPLNARFGLESGELELDNREVELVLAALGNQRRYCKGLADRNKDEEARARNLVWALEFKVLHDKIASATGNAGLDISPRFSTT